MLKGIVTISENRYKELLDAEVRIKAFAAYVNTRKYDIEKKICGAFLDFKVEEDGEG